MRYVFEAYLDSRPNMAVTSIQIVSYIAFT